MPQIKESITIDRPVNAVFKLVAETKQLDAWQPDVTSAHYSDEKLRVGVMITQNRNSYAMGWKMDLNADIVDYVPNRLIAYKGVLGRFPSNGRIEFESSGMTTTVIELIDIRVMFLYMPFSALIRGAVAKRTRQALHKLKALAESTR